MIRFLVERSLVVHLVSVFLIVLGIIAIANINREAFPNVNLDKVQIEIAYPGASPEEIERIIITPIEQELRSLDGIDTMTSIAFPGSGRINLELDPDASNRERIVSDVQLAVDRATLPGDMPEEPVVLEVDGKMIPIIQLAISAPRDEVALKRLVDDMEDDLLNIEGIARVQIQGDRRAELRVVADPDKLREHRISIGELAEVLENWNVNAPGGDLETPQGQRAIRIVGEYQRTQDISELVLRANERGEGIRLGDIAEVTESLEEANVYYDVSGTPALNVIVMKKAEADIIEAVDRINTYLETVPQRYGNDIQIESFQDFSYFAKVRLGVLTNNAQVGLILVFLSLIMFLRPSVALTTTWGIPIVFLTGLYVLYLSGITLNLVSMLGFIMVLGMLVDDAIIIGENITYHMERGLSPNEAAVTGAKELIGPVTATILTTVTAFMPMLFMSGIIGKFIVAIPTVVIALLVFSWLESFLILPSHVAHVTNSKNHPAERRWLVRLENGYAWILDKAIRRHWITLLISVAALALSLFAAINVLKFQLFPPVDVDEYIVRVTAPAGTSLDKMRKQMRTIDEIVREGTNPDYLETTIISTGQIAMDANDPLMQRGSRFGQIRVNYIPAVLREDHDVLDDMRRFESLLTEKFPNLQISLGEIKHGPPTGRALEVEISSNNNDVNEEVAYRLMDYVKSLPGITTIESGLQPGDPELHVVVDRVKAAYAGIDLATIASHVRAAVDGLRVTTTRKGTEEVDITIRLPNDSDDPVGTLMQLDIPNRTGGMVPMNRLAKLEEHEGYTTIRHKQGVRAVTVVANIDSKQTTSLEVNRAVEEGESQWLGEDADRVRVVYGGENEKNQESFADLKWAFGIALIGIFFILAIQFNNLGYPLLVMMAIPFGVVGIVISFLLHDLFWKDMPLSFFSTLGMVALTGVVVNSSLIMVVFIQRALEEGNNVYEAVMQAGRRRLRAVILTAATTVLGLLPTAYGWGGSDPFVAPMALALSWGLAFATLVTLLTIPAAFVAATRVKEGLIGIFRKSATARK
ncbi:MAG: efflux RND transporter permease subunit [Thiohalophilus sp.]|uniref:efflux RND transporter permease subunit n=1 Tax=Thiohalophilus sp. TaxID=3028392 RepID=UPI0028703DFD|nr:efflux RND transporter permease subunit [Thiohalophilus sp.]MDR9435248.1 efflux RND transporter permease subunit [Thiohalophilus sp.]